MVAKKDGVEDGWESMPVVEMNEVTSCDRKGTPYINKHPTHINL